MMKLKPCTILLWASDDNVTNVSTPTTAPASLPAGPPLSPHAADASVWITSWLARSCLNPETAPPVTDASDRKSTRLNSSHQIISYAVFCLKKKKKKHK